MLNITVQSVETFIRVELPKKLAEDLRHHRITMEADLETCAYYHLRRFLISDPRWIILARKHVPTGYYVDLLLFKRAIPRLALELKWNRSKIAEKDRRSLESAISELGLNKAYFLATCIRKAPFKNMTKTRVEKGRVFEVIVELGFTKEQLIGWKQTRRSYRKEMSLGNALNNNVV